MTSTEGTGLQCSCSSLLMSVSTSSLVLHRGGLTSTAVPIKYTYQEYSIINHFHNLSTERSAWPLKCLTSNFHPADSQKHRHVCAFVSALLTLIHLQIYKTSLIYRKLGVLSRVSSRKKITSGHVRFAKKTCP